MEEWILLKWMQPPESSCLVGVWFFIHFPDDGFYGQLFRNDVIRRLVMYFLHHNERPRCTRLTGKKHHIAKYIHFEVIIVTNSS